MKPVPTLAGIAVLVVAFGCGRRPTRPSGRPDAVQETPAASPTPAAEEGEAQQPVAAPPEDEAPPELTAKEREILDFYLDANFTAFEDEGGWDRRYFKKFDGTPAFGGDPIPPEQEAREKMALRRRVDEIAARKTRDEFGLSDQELQSLLKKVSPKEFEASYRRIRHTGGTDGFIIE